MVKLPVLRFLEIKDYQVYQNNEVNGLKHTFNGGVHLIIGVNGLGKTTLLNAIFRVLSGPKDIPKNDNAPLGSSGHTLSNWRNTSFFRSRVQDGALKAVINCQFTFGNDVLELSRKLSNLELTRLKLNGVELSVSEQEYENTIVSISGASDFVDFYSIIKYLLFFMEDRTELIWDERAQFEMLRILFFDQKSSLSAVKYYDEAQKADSKYRNINASLKSIKDRIREESNDEIDSIRSTYLLGKARLIALEDKVKDIQESYENKSNDYEESKLSLTKLAHEIDEIKFAIDYNQHLIYENYLPNKDEAIHYILRNLISGNGCLGCGNENASPEFLKGKINVEHKCPICNSDLTLKNIHKEQIEDVNAKLQILYSKFYELQKSYEFLNDDNSLLRSSLLVLEETLSQSLKDLRSSQKEMRLLEKKLPPDETEIQDLQRILLQREMQLRELDRDRRTAHENYVKILSENNEFLSNKMKCLEKKFDYYSKNLLTEKVFLRKEIIQRRIGQGIPYVDFPCFKVSMTSGVYDRTPSPREGASSVSESQKEFIDLAFRLSLIDLVTQDSLSPAMIVMETPEASLDSLFMHNAGRLFREFANKNNGENVFLASTNLNKSEMIPTLLGIAEEPTVYDYSDSDLILNEPGHSSIPKSVGEVSLADRANHIINLLSISAPSLSLKTYRKEYEKMYKDAVYPEGGKDE